MLVCVTNYYYSKLWHEQLSIASAPWVNWGCFMARVRSNKPLHFPLTNQKLGELFTLDFTAAEWRFYLYLATLDPFGDTGVKYNAEEVMLFCNIKPAKYYEAKAKFVPHCLTGEQKSAEDARKMPIITMKYRHHFSSFLIYCCSWLNFFTHWWNFYFHKTINLVIKL